MDGQILQDQLTEQDLAVFDDADVELEQDGDDYLSPMSDADKRLAASPVCAATLALLQEAQAAVRRGEFMTIEEADEEMDRELEEWLKVNGENHDV